MIQTNLEHDTIAAEKIIVKNDEIAKVFSKYFSETVEKLNIFEWRSCETKNTEDQLTDIINKYKSHPSIKKIKSNYTIKQKFSFKPVTVKDIENVIKNIPTNKVAGGEIPLNVLKQSAFTYVILTDCINDCSFHSTCSFRLLQEWQNELDKSGFIGTILMDLSKAYDCLPHDLLIAKFEAYGIGKSGLNLLLSYLSSRKQRTKVNSSYSDWYDIIRGVPQGSILGPLLFNLFINDLFLFLERTNICNFADDNTIYRCDSDLEIVLEDL